jgi:hypothetical protein
VERLTFTIFSYISDGIRDYSACNSSENSLYDASLVLCLSQHPTSSARWDARAGRWSILLVEGASWEGFPCIPAGQLFAAVIVFGLASLICGQLDSLPGGKVPPPASGALVLARQGRHLFTLSVD